MLYFPTEEERFSKSGLVTVLGALKAIYVPLEVREQVKERERKVAKLGIHGDLVECGEKLKFAKALEEGRIVCRDIGGSDPERTAAPRFDI